MIDEITEKSKQNIDTVLEYSSFLNYSLSDTYFIKLLYSLLCKAETYSNTYPMNIKIQDSSLSKRYDIHYLFGNTCFDIVIYGDVDIQKLSRMVQFAIQICSHGAELRENYKIMILKETNTELVPGNVSEKVSESSLKDTYDIIVSGDEILKKLLYECFRMFCLDFKEVDIDSTTMLEKIFKKRCSLPDVLCEFWARTLNIALFTFFIKSTYEAFEQYFIVNMNIERVFGMVQMKHHLEDSPDFGDYVLTPLLFLHFQQTMNWFVNGHETSLQFKKRNNHVYPFFYYLRTIYTPDKYLNILSEIKECSNGRPNKRPNEQPDVQVDLIKVSYYMSKTVFDIDFRHSSRSGMKGSAGD